MSITVKTRYLTYKISDDGQNESFTFANSSDRLIKGPVAKIISADKSEINSTSAILEGGILKLGFSDGTTAEVICTEHDDYVTFTLKSISRDNFHAITFVNIILSEPETDDCYQAVMLGMTLSTHMLEHPGDNRRLVASAYPHIGLFSTTHSPYPAKAAFFAAPADKVREIERLILDEIPDGEIPKSKTGGPYADVAERDARGDYFILMTDTATLDNVDKIVSQMQKLGLTQVNLHHYTHYRQGDFKCHKFPNGIEDFKAVVDAFHKHGIKVGLQTYSFFVVPSSSYVAPVPHKDLEIIREFTLKNDISSEDCEISVCESTDGVNSIESFIHTNSPYLWIDDEIVKFSLAENGKFVITKRGEYGTAASEHKKGAVVKQLKQYFLLPFARVGSELFYEIARKTAEFYNESGADMFYLDALDGTFVLDGEDYVWYHAMDFVREMFKYIKRDIIFDCCYNPQYTGTWFVRSRYGAVDVSLNAHRRYIDAHLNYNKKTAVRMGVTPELGWIDLFAPLDKNRPGWQCDTLFEEDLEYICAKAFASRASISFLESFRAYENLPIMENFSEILKKYSKYRANNSPTEATVEYLDKTECGAVLRDGALYKSKHRAIIFEQRFDKGILVNPFEEQIPSFRIEALCAADAYEHRDAVVLCDISENEPLKDACIRFDKPVSSKGNRGIGVWCKGDGSGAVICINLRNLSINKRKSSEYYIKADFTGWRYFAFYKAQNGVLPPEEYPMRELEYTTYNHLQEFYGYYRINFNFDEIDGVDIKVSGSDSIYMKPIHLVPHVEPSCKNPTLKFGESSIKIFTEIPANANLYFDGESCVVTAADGNIIDRPKYVGKPLISNGENEIIFERESENELSRVKLTVGAVGEKLQ